MPTNRKPAPEAVARTLEDGEIFIQGQFMLGSNYTFLVGVTLDGCELSAVYKPMRGEQPLWDFPPASLAGRELAAYRLSELLGWGIVPLTLLREGPLGPGSLQMYIQYDPNYHYFNFTPADRERLRPVAVFDLLVNNADRKGSHVLFEKRTRRLYAIDHGLCFHAEDKLRTVLWDYAAQPIPEGLLADVRKLLDAPAALDAALRDLLLPEELVALCSRSRALLADPVFPHPPPDRRAFPYPPV